MPGSAEYRSWGLTPDAPQRAVRQLNHPAIKDEGATILPFGRGRSYGDSCLNSSGVVLDTKDRDHFLAFDEKTGILKCESGVTLTEIIDVFLPRGWFLPVTPGTAEITVGGAVANDVHGKNHHSAGTFGCFVRSLKLWRSDLGEITCSADENPELFTATIGGLGLTGLILWVEFQLKAVDGPLIDVKTDPFQTLDEFMALSEQRADEYEYTVAWLDCLSTKDGGCRGLFYAGNHSTKQPSAKAKKGGFKPSVPFNFPSWVLNKLTIKMFNALYYWAGKRKLNKVADLRSFFYPLDGVKNWNRMYGKKGFYQYQCVIPMSEYKVMQNILNTIADLSCGSFLGVLKVFADVKSPGMLSFPQPGLCLALDIPNHGAKTEELLKKLDDIVVSVGGRINPSKDASMSAAAFQKFYPNYTDFEQFCDPKFRSDFWKRVTKEVKA